jgi:hypothetical protein
VSKRLGSLYRSGRSKDWLMAKNPKAPTVMREARWIGTDGDLTSTLVYGAGFIKSAANQIGCL